MPDRRSIFRLLALAGFLLTVALALWLTELRPLLVIIVVGIALLVAWTIEWLWWRQDMRRRGAEAVEVEEEPPFVPIPPAAAPPPAFGPVPEAPPPPPSPEPPAPAPIAAPAPAAPASSTETGAATDPHPEPPSEPEPVTVPEPAPVAAPAPAPEPAPAEPPPSVSAAPDPAPEPPRPVLRPVPTPAPAEPAPAAPPARPAGPAAASPGVVDLRTRVTVQPRRWNLWDLERRARDEAQRDPLRYQEWSYLFVHLRQFATPDGSLPVEFDDLVRESFGELLEHAGR